MMRRWISIKSIQLYRLTAELGWEWVSDEKHGLVLKNPRHGSLWQFHVQRGPKMRRIKEDEHEGD